MRCFQCATHIRLARLTCLTFKKTSLTDTNTILGELGGSTNKDDLEKEVAKVGVVSPSSHRGQWEDCLGKLEDPFVLYKQDKEHMVQRQVFGSKDEDF